MRVPLKNLDPALQALAVVDAALLLHVMLLHTCAQLPLSVTG